MEVDQSAAPSPSRSCGSLRDRAARGRGRDGRGAACRRAESHPLFEELCNWLGAERRTRCCLRARSTGDRLHAAAQVGIGSLHRERPADRQQPLRRPCGRWRSAARTGSSPAARPKEERAATLYSLVVGCWELGVDPFAYLRDVLERLGTTPSSEIARLTPRGWAAEQAAI
ncbi:MAG: transposase domain-containing protein [Planctomycetota bacterium]